MPINFLRVIKKQASLFHTPLPHAPGHTGVKPKM